MRDNINNNLSEALKQKGIDPNSLKNADAGKLMSSLSKDDAAKLNAILNDKKALNQILNSEKAKNMMKNLFGEK